MKAPGRAFRAVVPPRDMERNLSLEVRLVALIDKYQRLLALRCDRESLEKRGVHKLVGAEGQARQARMRAVAQRFPGALREMEHLDAASLIRRIDDLAQEVRSAQIHPRRRQPQRLWIRVILDYHAGLRRGLSLRSWLRGLRPPHLSPTALLDKLAQHPAAWAATVDRNALARYRHPPGGRLSELVLQDVAARHRRTVAYIRRIVLGDG